MDGKEVVVCFVCAKYVNPLLFKLHILTSCYKGGVGRLRLKSVREIFSFFCTACDWPKKERKNLV